jgi:predicted PurR-regulated permease PerM
MDPLNQLLSPGLLIPVVAILMPLIVVVVALNFAYRYQERKHKTIVDLLEKGLPVPRELLRSPQRAGSALMRALTLVGVGVGVCIFLGLLIGFDHGVWACGLIPLCIGIAQLIALKLEPQRPEPDEPSAIDLQ